MDIKSGLALVLEGRCVGVTFDVGSLVLSLLSVDKEVSELDAGQ